MGLNGIFATPIGWLMTLIYKLISNYGLSIIILTTVVRLILLPLYSKQMKYNAKMNELQPKIKEIQDRYANDKDKMNEKINEVYAENKLSPLSGCLPLLIQFPIIIGLFSLLRTPLQYMTSPEMIAAVHEEFLWMGDLCQPDTWILPILAAVTTYFTYSANALGQEGGGQQGAMKAMQYFFPVMIFLMARSFPSGLAIYWTVGNIFQIAQSLILSSKSKKEKLKAEAARELAEQIKAEKKAAKANK